MAINAKVIKKDEQIKVSSLITLIYGEPGTGKTTLANAGEDVLLLDFEKGAHRAATRGDVVQIFQWEEIKDISEDDVKDYKTIVIDAVGAMQDSIIKFISNNNPKAFNSNGAFSQQSWGLLKSIIANFIYKLRSFNKDIIFITHNKEERDGDLKTRRPEISGGAYSELMKVCDLVGFIGMVDIAGNSVRKLSFNPTYNRVGKNSAGLDDLIIPSVFKNKNMMDGILQKAKDAINSLSEEQKQALKLINDYRERAYSTESPESLTDVLRDLEAEENIDPLLIKQIKFVIHDKMREADWDYDKKQKVFITKTSASDVTNADNKTAEKKDKQINKGDDESAAEVIEPVKAQHENPQVDAVTSEPNSPKQELNLPINQASNQANAIPEALPARRTTKASRAKRNEWDEEESGEFKSTTSLIDEIMADTDDGLEVNYGSH